LETWPDFVLEQIEKESHEHVLAKVDAIRRYFSNEPVAKIARITGIPNSDLPRLAKRCLMPSSDGRIMGFRALLPYSRLKDYERTAAERTKFPEEQGGQAGALSRLLGKFPELEDTLVKHIRQDAKLQQVPEHKLRPRDLHRIFIKLLNDKGLPKTDWPFTTKFLGKRSIERYMRRILDCNFYRTVATRESQEARAHLSVGTGHEAFLSYDEPYAAVEIDAYSIESHLCVLLQTPEGTETDVLLERLWLIAAVDRFSSAILSYTVVYRSEVNADNVLAVIRDAATGRWTPRELTLGGLTYPPGAGLPSGVIAGAQGAIWTSTLLDGALAHLSRAVHERARRALGFAINWGPVGHFERRPTVERTFNQIAKDLFKRLPSTTGSSPKNGRADNAEQKALRHRIRAADVEELLDVTIAQHNAMPSEGTSSMSPLEVLRYFLEDPRRPFLVRRLPLRVAQSARTLAIKEIATVRGGYKTGRRPYVQVDRVHYSSPVLSNAGHLVGKSLTLEIDEDDMRQVRAFLSNGAELGILKAHGKWGVTKHSRRTRRAINSLLAKRVLVLSEFDDPMQVYMRHIAKPEGKKPLTPRQATQLTQLAKEAGQVPRIPAALPAPPEPEVKPVRKSLIPEQSNFFGRVKNRR
jgi:hypothetical protein